jgi:hypothetical protein
LSTTFLVTVVLYSHWSGTTNFIALQTECAIRDDSSTMYPHNHLILSEMHFAVAVAFPLRDIQNNRVNYLHTWIGSINDLTKGKQVAASNLCWIAIQGCVSAEIWYFVKPQCSIGPPSLPRLPHIHFPWRIFTQSKPLHDWEMVCTETLRASILLLLAFCQVLIIYIHGPAV